MSIPGEESLAVPPELEVSVERQVEPSGQIPAREDGLAGGRGIVGRIFSGMARFIIRCLTLLFLLLGGLQVGMAVLWYWLPAGRNLMLAWREELAWRRMEALRREQMVEGIKREIERLRTDNGRLQKEAVQRLPGAPYIVVDTRNNTLLLRDNDKLLRQAICSTGSGKRLTTPDGRREWQFHTPKGIFKVLSKHYLPVWIKPDWAFWEEGKKPPPANSPERFDEAVLGEYALSFGNGFLIHGTLYGKAQLGQSVTHGCVRLDDDDLRFVYETAPVGTKIYIF